jgi:hypothetical protein
MPVHPRPAPAHADGVSRVAPLHDSARRLTTPQQLPTLPAANTPDAHTPDGLAHRSVIYALRRSRAIVSLADVVEARCARSMAAARQPAGGDT